MSQALCTTSPSGSHGPGFSFLDEATQTLSYLHPRLEGSHGWGSSPSARWCPDRSAAVTTSRLPQAVALSYMHGDFRAMKRRWRSCAEAGRQKPSDDSVDTLVAQ